MKSAHCNFRAAHDQCFIHGGDPTGHVGLLYKSPRRKGTANKADLRLIWLVLPLAA
jgi:hypothetical protein